MATNQNLLALKEAIEMTLIIWKKSKIYDNTDVLVSTENFSNTEDAFFYDVELRKASNNDVSIHVFHFCISDDEKSFWIHLEHIDETGELDNQIFFEFPIVRSILKPHSLFCDWFDGTYNSLVAGSQD